MERMTVVPRREREAPDGRPPTLKIAMEGGADA